MNPSSRVFDTRTNVPEGSATAGASGAVGNVEAAVKVSGAGRCRIRLESVQTKRGNGASATVFTPFVTNVSGASSSDMARKWIAAAGTAAGAMQEALSINRIIEVGPSGCIYFTPGGDAADKFDYEIAYEVVG